MSLRDTLIGGLTPVTASLVREMGVRCSLRRPDDEVGSTDDGTPLVEWYRPQNSDILGEPVYLYAGDEQSKRKLWGAESDVTVTGLAIRNPIREGDRVKPKDGEYRGQVLQVVRRLPDDISNIATLGLIVLRLPDDDDGGF